MKWVLFSLFVATANVQMGPEEPDFEKEFGEMIAQASIQLQNAAEKRPLRIKKLNDSLAETAAAARGLALGGDPKEIVKHLERARDIHPKNNFSLLLQAIVLNSQGKTEQSTIYFEKFLLQSRTYSEFEETFIRWGHFHQLRRIVYHLLQSRGVSFEGREKDIQVVVPYGDFIKYIMDPDSQDWVMNVVFVAIILGGGVLLAITAIMGVDFSEPLPGTLAIFYLLFWVAYALWLFDLAFGLPGEWNRHQVVPVFLAATMIPLALFEGYLHWKETHRPLEKGYMRCPHCRAIIVELSLQCSECRRPIKK